MKQNRAVGTNTMAGSLMIGTAVCTGITLACTAAGATMISAGSLPETAAGYIAMIAQFLAAFGGAATGAGNVKEKRLYVCLMIAAIFFAILLAMTAMFFGSRFAGVGMTALVLMSGAVAAAMLGKGKGRRRNLHGSKIKHR